MIPIIQSSLLLRMILACSRIEVEILYYAKHDYNLGQGYVVTRSKAYLFTRLIYRNLIRIGQVLSLTPKDPCVNYQNGQN